jgi:molybdenum cofactor cytidylyltransferase
MPIRTETSPPRYGIIVLAAGGSSRFGQPKQLASYGGKTLLRRAVETALASVYAPVIVVLGAQAEQMRLELEGLRVTICENARWEEGMTSSIQAGMEAIPTEADGTAIMLCDQPLLTPEVLNALAAKLVETQAPLAACEYGNTLGVPALFTRPLYAEIFALSGTEGAKAIIRRHASLVAHVPFPDGAVDIDTPEDFSRLAK